MKKKLLASILILAVTIAGCGQLEEEKTLESPNKQQETIVDTEIVDDSVVPQEEDKETEELVEESIEEVAQENVPVEQVQPKETQKTEQKETQTKTETPVPTTPVVSESAISVEPETKVEECEHWYQPIETIEYDMVIHYVFWSNCCGYPLFTIENRDAVNISDLYVHPDYHDEDSGITCTKKFISWHSEYFYSGFCYQCHGRILLRTCTVFYVRAEQCVKNEGALGEYEKLEPGHAYIESCDCGQNILMSGSSGKGLMLTKEECCYCGDIKTYP